MRLTDAIKKIWNFGLDRHEHLPGSVGWHPISGNSYAYYKENSYENAYPSIRVLSSRFAAIEPITVDKNGESVGSNLLDRLYTPNTAMSAYDFREALAVMSLMHNKVYIRVHKRTGKLTADTITGFTFLEGVNERIIDGKLEYWLPNAEKLDPDAVIVLKSINPYRLNDGFSHAYAARRWTTIDDLIADYQAGFFRNGAVPTGQFVITAKTASDFKDMKASILRYHQGASKNNNVMFAHRPLDASGAPLAPQVEWIPFATGNKDMALKELFDEANQKIDSVYGVPASLRGVNDQNTYASVKVDEQIFIENTLRPFALKVWTKFTHELNRITGGLGLAITFELEPPTVAEEELVKAQAQGVTAQTLTLLTGNGYTLESAIQYVTSNDPLVLVRAPEEVERPEVLDSEEAKDTPDQPIDPSYVGKAFSPSDRQAYEDQLANVLKQRFRAQVEAAIPLAASKDVTPDKPIDPTEDSKLKEDMLSVLVAVIMAQGRIEQTDNIQIILEAGISADQVGPFVMTGAQRDAYADYLTHVSTSINETTANKIRSILEVGREQSQTASQIRTNLQGLVNEDWRITQITATEINKAGNQASLYSMQNIAEATGATVEKVWQHSGSDSPCEFCQAYIGTSVPLNQDFISLGETYHGVDGGIRINDFQPLDVAGLHPACHCRQVYRVEPE